MVTIRFISNPVFKFILSTHEDDGYQYRKDLNAGDANWHDYNEGTILSFVCPCGCGSLHQIMCGPGNDGHHWQWDGNREMPTLTPSLQLNSACRWHGFLTNGVFLSV